MKKYESSYHHFSQEITSSTLLIKDFVFRKRESTAEDESSEFMPLSKRINNLHLNGLSAVPQPAEGAVEKMDADWEPMSFVPSPNQSEPSQGSSSCDGFGSNTSNVSYEYRPDLNASENPFYYENNKLLFTLYMERAQRATQPYWPLFFISTELIGFDLENCQRDRHFPRCTK